jgi:type I restriction enzyme R subunit
MVTEVLQISISIQGQVVQQLVANGWLLGTPDKYNRELALYEEDVLGFVKDTQDEQWQKFCALYPNNPEQKFVERGAAQLSKADPNAANKELRTFGTLGVLRHERRDRGMRFSLCQFKPEHDLNPATLARYKQNRLRVVTELVQPLGDRGASGGNRQQGQFVAHRSGLVRQWLAGRDVGAEV